MTLRKLLLIGLGFTAVIAALHAWLNLGLGAGAPRGDGRKPIKVGFLPVT
jgi:hypothetical protein